MTYLINDISSLKKIRELWDLINYDLNFWIEIAKKKAEDEQEAKNSWNQLGDILWNLAPKIENRMLEIEHLTIKLESQQDVETQNNTYIESFYKNSGTVIMEVALVIKVTDILKEMAKTPQTPEKILELMETINLPLNSKNFESPITIIEKEKLLRNL